MSEANSLSKLPFKEIFIGSDHAGFELKRHLMTRYPFLPWKDLGTFSTDSVDYPDIARRVCDQLKSQLPNARGILICGSGQGMAISANRFPFVRAALCFDEELARLAREHNDANILCMGGRLTPFPVAEKILETFLQTPFGEGRHRGRVDKMGC